MALEIPNVIAAAASATVTLLSIEGAGPVIRTYGLEVNGSVNISSAEFFDGENTTTDNASATPDATLWGLLVEFNPAQLVFKFGGYGECDEAVFGPVVSPTGIPQFDDLEPGQLLLSVNADVFPQQEGMDPEVGAAVRYGFAIWEIPPGGALEGEGISGP